MGSWMKLKAGHAIFLWEGGMQTDEHLIWEATRAVELMEWIALSVCINMMLELMAVHFEGKIWKVKDANGSTCRWFVSRRILNPTVNAPNKTRSGVRPFRRKHNVRTIDLFYKPCWSKRSDTLCPKPLFIHRASSTEKTVPRRVRRRRRMRNAANVPRSFDHREDILGRPSDPRMWHSHRSEKRRC